MLQLYWDALHEDMKILLCDGRDIEYYITYHTSTSVN